MDRKLFDSLDESLKKKLRSCKDQAEMQQVLADAGLQELGDELVEGISGGAQAIPPEWVMKDE